MFLPQRKKQNSARNSEWGGKIILTVGRFSYMKGYGKGFDVLLKAMRFCPENYSLYIVGDEPTQEFIEMKNNLKLKNVFFVGFKTKEELKEYYKAADIFCLQTRGDVWGLVVNEAMACGLPIITTDKCVAGLELVEDGINGYIVGTEDDRAVSEKILSIGQQDKVQQKMCENSLSKIKKYTIEIMASVHKRAFGID